MKTRLFSKKLSLRKHTVTALQSDQLKRVNGGVDPTILTICDSMLFTCPCVPTQTACQTVCPGGPYC